MAIDRSNRRKIYRRLDALSQAAQDGTTQGVRALAMTPTYFLVRPSTICGADDALPSG